MSEKEEGQQPTHNKEGGQQPKQAVPRKSRWPGWIWAVPIAALGIVIWLGVQALMSKGPEVTVTFESAGGVKASETKVKYHDMEVGEVESVSLRPDLKHVDVQAEPQPRNGRAARAGYALLDFESDSA